jgi:hypothetical protein
MNELVKQVTPLTRAIIWLTKDESDTLNSHYKDIDYLIDGMLTANIKASSGKVSSRVIIGTSFSKTLIVMVVSEIKAPELQSFVSLIQKDLGPEQDIIMIDEIQSFEQIKSELKAISNNIRLIS